MKKVFTLNTNKEGLILLDSAVKKLSLLPKKDKNIREKEISDLINSGGELDAETIMNVVSPTGNFDVFISHYHEDEKIAQKVAMLLIQQGYKPFIDSQYWLHFDSVTERLNNLHFHKDKKGSDVYDHDKTIMIQKHCDVLLLSALLRVISNCDYLIFINIPKSIQGLEYYSKTESKKPKTYSPWIYWELLVADLLFKNNATPLIEGTQDSFAIPTITYKLSTKNMVKISINDILQKRWQTK